MDKEIEYIKEQRENFLKICNKEFKQNEYYNIIMNIDYDDYDNIIMTTQDIYIEVPKYLTVKERGMFGFTREVREIVSAKERVGIYAVKNPYGIFEMTTGKELSITGKNNAIHCIGISRVPDYCLDKVAKDLKLLESDTYYKKQFIDKLNELNTFADRKQKMYNEHLRERNYNIQYLKKYKLPHND